MKNKKEIISKVSANVSKEISDIALRGGKWSGALSTEGYHGGYRDALWDVLLLFNGVIPNRHGWWEK